MFGNTDRIVAFCLISFQGEGPQWRPSEIISVQPHASQHPMVSCGRQAGAALGISRRIFKLRVGNISGHIDWIQGL
jgi:hypothetical protein